MRKLGTQNIMVNWTAGGGLPVPCASHPMVHLSLGCGRYSLSAQEAFSNGEKNLDLFELQIRFCW